MNPDYEPGTEPDPDFDYAWPEIVWRLDYLQQETDRRAKEEFLMNVWYEQWYREQNPEIY